MEQKRSSNLSEHVFQYLSDRIAAGVWKEGDRLPSEHQLCDLLGASRTTVRSAIGRLTGLGLAKSVRGKGTFVSAPIPSEDLSSLLHLNNTDRLSIFEFRKIIESESAALAALRADSTDVLEMEYSIMGMESGHSQENVAAQDMAFHYLIARAARNEIILRIFEVMRSTYARMFEDNIAKMGNAGVEHHRRILLAIQTRDMKAARQCMLNHLDDTMRSVCTP